MDDERWLDRGPRRRPWGSWPVGSRPRLSVWCSRPGSLAKNRRGCRSSRCGACGIRACLGFLWGGTQGIALLVRSAYPHRRGTCFTYGLASLERLEEPAVLLGRRGECALIGAFLDWPADDTALLLRGEPGAGKTVLLDAAADAASAAKAWVLRAAGVQSEAELTFSGLHQLLRPVYEEELHGLSAVHRDALKIVPGFGGGPAPDRLLMPTRQEGPELRHMACEVSSAPCSTGSRRGYPQPAAAYAAAGRTGRHIPTICGWEVHDEPACAGQR